jgi:prepilin peptidase dependent protein B
MRMIAARMPTRWHRTLGLSIVELLVGIAIGLFILAGASMVTSTQLADNRSLLLETQVQQDLRAAADLITREVRRTGFWGNAAKAVWPAAGVSAVNAYQELDASAGAGGRTEIKFSYSNPTGGENDTLDNNEKYGYAWNADAGTIEAQIGGGGWQTLTDPSVMRVTEFAVQVTPQVLQIPCPKPCEAAAVVAGTCPPQQTVRDVVIRITAKAVHDPSVVRSVRSGVRLRNDAVTGGCSA